MIQHLVLSVGFNPHILSGKYLADSNLTGSTMSLREQPQAMHS